MGRGGSRGYRVFQGSLEVKRFRVPQGFARSSQGFTGILYRPSGSGFSRLACASKTRLKELLRIWGTHSSPSLSCRRKSIRALLCLGFGGLGGFGVQGYLQVRGPGKSCSALGNPLCKNAQTQLLSGCSYSASIHPDPGSPM